MYFNKRNMFMKHRTKLSSQSTEFVRRSVVWYKAAGLVVDPKEWHFTHACIITC